MEEMRDKRGDVGWEGDAAERVKDVEDRQSWLTEVRREYRRLRTLGLRRRRWCTKVRLLSPDLGSPRLTPLSRSRGPARDHEGEDVRGRERLVVILVPYTHSCKVIASIWLAGSMSLQPNFGQSTIQNGPNSRRERPSARAQPIGGVRDKRGVRPKGPPSSSLWTRREERERACLRRPRPALRREKIESPGASAGVRAGPGCAGRGVPIARPPSQESARFLPLSQRCSPPCASRAARSSRCERWQRE